jgi:carboxylesterase
MSNEILELCTGYSRIIKDEGMGKVIFPFYKEKDSIRLVATPWKMLHPNKSKIAVLCCHGYTGTPGELDEVGLEIYNKGFDVYCPRLPGHGATGKEFCKSKAKDWIATEISAAQYLKDNYDDFYIIGHSMGGLNAVILAEMFDVKRIALIAPAFDLVGLDDGFTKIKIKLGALINYSYNVDWATDTSYYGICERDDDDDLWLGAEIWSHVFAKSVVQLSKERDIAAKSLRKLKSSTLLIRGTNDPSVKRSVISRFKRDFTGKLEVLEIEGAGHLVMYEPTEDYSQICNKSVAQWLDCESII